MDNHKTVVLAFVREIEAITVQMCALAKIGENIESLVDELRIVVEDLEQYLYDKEHHGN